MKERKIASREQRGERMEERKREREVVMSFGAAKNAPGE
jgi:hypothetical protein